MAAVVILPGSVLPQGRFSSNMKPESLWADTEPAAVACPGATLVLMLHQRRWRWCRSSSSHSATCWASLCSSHVWSTPWSQTHAPHVLRQQVTALQDEQHMHHALCTTTFTVHCTVHKIRPLACPSVKLRNHPQHCGKSALGLILTMPDVLC